MIFEIDGFAGESGEESKLSVDSCLFIKNILYFYKELGNPRWGEGVGSNMHLFISIQNVYRY